MKITRQSVFWKTLTLAGCMLVVLAAAGFDGPSVRVETTDPSSPRELEPQTQQAVVHDYLLAWQTMSNALKSNQTGLLDAVFVGVAKEKLVDTIREQEKLGIQTHYVDRSHDLKFLFYSPEGLSIQLQDTVEYDLELTDHNKQVGTRHIRARYVAVLSPTEVRWKVRILQAEAQ